MLSLAEFQRHMAAEILHEAPQGGVEVHRATILGALVNALQLTFPTVVKLTGADFFDQVAIEYAQDNPPRSAVLHFYGDGFPYSLRDNTAVRTLPYLWDVARFDLAIDRAAHASVAGYTEAITIDAQLQVRLASSLSCLRVDYPVDLLRDCLDAGRPEELSGLDMTPRTRHFAIWRGAEGASVKLLSPASAAFLHVLLEGAAAEEALRQAMECASATDVLAAIQSELFSASFMRLTWHSQPGNPR
jgi:Putative DNA-binding domain